MATPRASEHTEADL